MARRFSSSQRVALFLAAQGRCELCGDELQPGWHADHVIPWARNGETDTANGQALCPTCNLRKGSSMQRLAPWSKSLRNWQDRANSSARALRALRTHAPEQHARVLAGELSPHRAMVEAGLRKPTWTAPADIDDLARALARRYPSDAIIQALLRLEADPVAELQQSLSHP